MMVTPMDGRGVIQAVNHSRKQRAACGELAGDVEYLDNENDGAQTSQHVAVVTFRQPVRHGDGLQFHVTVTDALGKQDEAKG